MSNSPAIVFRWLINGLVVVFSGTVTACVLVVLLVYAVFGDQDLSISALRPVVEEQINRLAGDGTLAVEDLTVNLGNAGVSLGMKVSHHGPDGRQRFSLPDVRATLSYGQLLAGRIRLRALRISSAELELRRGPSGDLAIPGGAGFPAALLGGPGGAIDRFVELGPLSVLEEIEFSDVTLVIGNGSGVGRGEIRISEAGLIRADDRAMLSVAAEWLRPGVPPLRVDALLTREFDAEVTRLTAGFDAGAAVDPLPADDSTRNSSRRLLELALPATLSLDIRDGADRSTAADTGVREAETGLDTPAEDFPVRAVASMVDLTFSSPDGNLEATGELSAAADADGGIERISMDLAFTGGQFFMPWFSGDPLRVRDGGVRAAVNVADGGLEVDRFWLADEWTRADMTYSGTLGRTGTESRLHVEIDSMSMPRVLGFWPSGFVPRTREWLARSVDSATFSGIEGSFSFGNGVSDHDVRFDFEDAVFRIEERLPAVTGGRGTGQVRGGSLEVTLDSGRMTGPGDAAARLDGSRFSVADLGTTDSFGELDLDVEADLAFLVHVFDTGLFPLSGTAEFDVSGLDGRVEGDGTIGIRFGNGRETPLKHAEFLGVVRGLRMPIPEGTASGLGGIVTADAISARLENETLVLNGGAEVGGHAVEAEWTLEFRDGRIARNELGIDFDLSGPVLEEFGISIPEVTLDGQSRARLDIGLDGSKVSAFSLDSDLVGIAASIPALRWNKPHEQAGRLVLERSPRESEGYYQVRLETPDLWIEGLVEVDGDGRVVKLQFPRLAVGGRIDTSAIIALDGERVTEVALHRGMIDIRNFRLGEGGAPLVPMDLNFDRVIINDQISLTEFHGKLGQGGKQGGDFSGKINGEIAVTGKINPRQNGAGMVIAADDGGGVARAAGYFKSAYGGDFRMEVTPAGDGDGFDAGFRFRNVRVENASVLAELLNLVSVAGLLQQLSGEGLHFDNVIGNIRMRPDGIRVSGLSAVGPSVGISLSGWYEPAGRTVDFEGVIAPVLLFGIVDGIINTVFGPLFGGSDSASIIGFSYRMEGLVDQPDMTVNPLSILTPGRFREIFRQDAPQPPASE